MNHLRWIQHFENNRRHRPEPDWNAPLVLPPGALPAVRRSVEQFQLGDGGGPACLIARNADSFRHHSAARRRVVDLWFAEEREHARLLGCAVDRLGGRRIESHWSFQAFCGVRRWFGVAFELQVLLLTEIVSTAYYRLLHRHCPDPALKAACQLILRDEAGHVAFHGDRLASAGRWPRGLWRVQFIVCGYAAATMLWINHRPAITALGGSTRSFYREVTRELGRFLGRLARNAHAPRTPTPARLVPHAPHP